MIIFKRYDNRKVYDTMNHKYVNTAYVLGLKEEGKEVKIVDFDTKEDVTDVMLLTAKYLREKKNLKNRIVV